MNIECLVDYRNLGIRILGYKDIEVKSEQKNIKIGTYKNKRFIKIGNNVIEIKVMIDINRILLIKSADEKYYTISNELIKKADNGKAMDLAVDFIMEYQKKGINAYVTDYNTMIGVVSQLEGLITQEAVQEFSWDTGELKMIDRFLYVDESNPLFATLTKTDTVEL
jgi:hypothetical protein